MGNELTAAAVARKLVRQFKHGFCSRLEVLTLLIEAGGEYPPSELADELPADWIEVIKEATSSPPSSPSDVVHISGMIGGPDFDYEAHCAKNRQSWYDGAWSWHRYFPRRS